MADFGYDVSDYRSIDPQFGTLDDVDRLIHEAHRRDIRVVFDMVLNHTSEEHKWFCESRSSKDDPKRDFYLWREKPVGGYPNNWYAAFGGRAWSVDHTTGSMYLHSFLKEQPDLNWRNDEVVEAVFGEIAYWLDRGIDGFRLDVINLIVKDEHLRDNPPGWGGRVRPYDLQRHVYDRNRVESHEKLKRFRRMIDRYDQRMLVGEIMVEKPGEPEVAASYLGDGEDELHLAFDFTFTWLPWDPRAWRDAAVRWERAIPEHGWPCWVLNNHDVQRSTTRWKTNPMRAKIAALFLLTQRGTPFIYYGEELGMRDLPVKRRDIRDPLGKRYWPFHRGRDGARRPMKWDESLFSGFSGAHPWLPCDTSDTASVEMQRRDPLSLLHVYREVIQLRNHDHVLRRGITNWIDLGSSIPVLAYVRDDGSDRRLVLLNFSGKEVSFPALPVQKAMESEMLRVLYSTVPGDVSVEGRAQRLSLQSGQGMICQGG